MDSQLGRRRRSSEYGEGYLFRADTQKQDGGMQFCGLRNGRQRNEVDHVGAFDFSIALCKATDFFGV